jgi:hypothetical protein
VDGNMDGNRLGWSLGSCDIEGVIVGNNNEEESPLSVAEGVRLGGSLGI